MKQQVPDTSLKLIAIPIIDRLPDDPEWENTELEIAAMNKLGVES